MKVVVHGLKGRNGLWFYVADCPWCGWSFNWDSSADYTWAYIQTVAVHHWWTYSDLASHK